MEETGSLSASPVYSLSCFCWVTSMPCYLRFELFHDPIAVITVEPAVKYYFVFGLRSGSFPEQRLVI